MTLLAVLTRLRTNNLKGLSATLTFDLTPAQDLGLLPQRHFVLLTGL